MPMLLTLRGMHNRRVAQCVSTHCVSSLHSTVFHHSESPTPHSIIISDLVMMYLPLWYHIITLYLIMILIITIYMSKFLYAYMHIYLVRLGNYQDVCLWFPWSTSPNVFVWFPSLVFYGFRRGRKRFLMVSVAVFFMVSVAAGNVFLWFPSRNVFLWFPSRQVTIFLIFLFLF